VGSAHPSFSMEDIAAKQPEMYKVVGTALDSEGKSHNLYEVQYVPRRGMRGERQYVCALCGRLSWRSETVRVEGKRYCLVNRCAQEKQDDRRRNRS